MPTSVESFMPPTRRWDSQNGRNNFVVRERIPEMGKKQNMAEIKYVTMFLVKVSKKEMLRT
jgi:hypothetical protein